jgi:hypothetical protein
VLEFVEVFAIDKHIYGSEMAQDGKAKNLTLLVTPLQAKAVALASNLGKLSTTLRRPGDAPPADPKGLHEDFTAEFLEEMQDKSDGDKPGVAGVDDSAGAYQPQKPIGTSISDLVDAELEQTEQVMSGEQSEGTEEGPHWLLEIHERDKVRVERVKLTDPAEVGTKI